jgi:hypothetical protein
VSMRKIAAAVGLGIVGILLILLLFAAFAR